MNAKYRKVDNTAFRSAYPAEKKVLKEFTRERCQNSKFLVLIYYPFAT